jgi:hypothetical protein
VRRRRLRREREFVSGAEVLVERADGSAIVLRLVDERASERRVTVLVFPTVAAADAAAVLRELADELEVAS